jgi:hypothetical protein
MSALLKPETDQQLQLQARVQLQLLRHPWLLHLLCQRQEQQQERRGRKKQQVQEQPEDDGSSSHHLDGTAWSA